MLQLGLGLEPGNVIFCVKVTNTFVLHVNGNCDVHGLRTTKVRDVTMMYCKERYMENVPYLVVLSWNGRQQRKKERMHS